jgi:hypothetical protein
MRATWYVLEDGSVVDPNYCAPDSKGVMRHASGVAVAMRGGAYSSRGVDPEEMQAKETMPEPVKSGYKTREAKAKA